MYCILQLLLKTVSILLLIALCELSSESLRLSHNLVSDRLAGPAADPAIEGKRGSSDGKHIHTCTVYAYIFLQEGFPQSYVTLECFIYWLVFLRMQYALTLLSVWYWRYLPPLQPGPEHSTPVWGSSCWQTGGWTPHHSPSPQWPEKGEQLRQIRVLRSTHIWRLLSTFVSIEDTLLSPEWLFHVAKSKPLGNQISVHKENCASDRA